MENNKQSLEMNEDKGPTADIVVTRNQCSSLIHYNLENANYQNIWENLGLKQPDHIPMELRSPNKQGVEKIDDDSGKGSSLSNSLTENEMHSVSSGNIFLKDLNSTESLQSIFVPGDNLKVQSMGTDSTEQIQQNSTESLQSIFVPGDNLKVPSMGTDSTEQIQQNSTESLQSIFVPGDNIKVPSMGTDLNSTESLQSIFVPGDNLKVTSMGSDSAFQNMTLKGSQECDCKTHILVQQVTHRLVHTHDDDQFTEEMFEFKETVLNEEDMIDPIFKKLLNLFASKGYRVPDCK